VNAAGASENDLQMDALKAELKLAQAEMLAAEEELADRNREIFAFEAKVERRIGDLLAALNALNEEIVQSTKTIEALREERIFGKEHGFKDPNYWRNWVDRSLDTPPPPREQLQVEIEAQIKELYRELAREFHPDLAKDEAESEFRANKMAALNEAYAARNLAVLKMLAVEARLVASTQVYRPVSKPKDPEKALEYEMDLCRRRTRELRAEISNLHINPSVQLSLDVKLARREGRDLLGEMAADLRKNIARKTAERDYLKAALDQLDQDS
jgi:hypothetical protein